MSEKKEREREKKRRGGGVWRGVIRKVSFGATREYELIKRAHFPTEEQIENIVGKAKHANVITPTEISASFDLKVSTAKKILEVMKKEGLLEYTDFSDSNFRAYTPVK